MTTRQVRSTTKIATARTKPIASLVGWLLKLEKPTRSAILVCLCGYVFAKWTKFGVR
eukprot:CAMPEP_0194482754 /NCGR_PEP_ID=MMETSP0253-20130528/4558_1 /TAXON_ID=2966 /ORGANISM="Noctiluca scintillans" /LENGTH=56 /DNA_ID=CAMNT_0039322313 /DNA_START=272 /DNA_END=438 /DNA_ORIENTATION=+